MSEKQRAERNYDEEVIAVHNAYEKGAYENEAEFNEALEQVDKRFDVKKKSTLTA